MLKFTAFTTKKPRQFEYKPRFYNPEKEAREERKKELLGIDPEEEKDGEYKPGQYIRKQRLYRSTQPPKRKTEDTIVRLVRFTIMAILAAIVIIFFIKL